MNFRTVLVLILIVALGLFALSNARSVPVNLIVGYAAVPVCVLALGPLAVGGLVGLLVGLWHRPAVRVTVPRAEPIAVPVVAAPRARRWLFARSAR